jgi:hypothetical protein
VLGEIHVPFHNEGNHLTKRDRVLQHSLGQEHFQKKKEERRKKKEGLFFS